ncbi:MAG: hypothetical protein NC245_02920 [Muribaculum sp.]|nr:hypothetical protein [Muribaculum sp.]
MQREETERKDLVEKDFVAFPVATCQGRIHHFLSLFLGLPYFPYSKSWRMTRFNLSSTLWVLVAENVARLSRLSYQSSFANRALIALWC